MNTSDPHRHAEDARPDVALITGAGSGIGRETAILLGQRGFRLALLGRNPAALAETARLVGRMDADVLQISCDIGDAEQIGPAIEKTVETLGSLEILVNNAGLAGLFPIGSVTVDAIERSFRVNALGPALLIRAAWPHLCARRRGCIVNVSTMGTKDPFPGFFAYAAAKASTNLMAASCAKEGKSKGIRAFCVAPGAVETGMLRSMFDEKAIPRGRCLTAGEVARVIVECIERKRESENGAVIFLSKT